ncbi:hypothetical protein ABPG74_005172 [Tetrahymena malaccensis]
MKLFRYLIIFLNYCLVFYCQCFQGCNSCIQSQSNLIYTCLGCAPDFQYDIVQSDCIYQKCQSKLYLLGQSQQAECVSICNDNQISNKQINQCVESNTCTQNYISQATLSNNQVILDIIPYSSQNYLIKYNGFLNVIDSNSGQFIVAIQTSSKILLCDFIFNKLIIVTQDNMIQQWIIENQSFQYINQIFQGSVSSTSVMRSLSQDLLIITSTDQNKQYIFLNIFKSIDSSFNFINYISIQIYNQKFNIFDSFIMLISQDNQIKLFLIVQNSLNTTTSLQVISNDLQCGFTADNTVLNIFTSPDQNTLLIFIKKNQAFYSYSKVLHSCQKINLDNNLIDVSLINFQDSSYLIYQFSSSLQFYQFNQQVISQISTISDIIDYQCYVQYQKIYLLVLTADNTLSLHSSNLNINSSFTIQQQINIKIVNPYFLKLIFSQPNQIQIFVAGYDFQLISVNLPNKLNNISTITPFSQQITSNKSQINKIYFDSVTQLLYSCSQEGQLVIWNSISSFNLKFYKSFNFINDNCRDFVVYKNQYIAVLLSSSIQIFDIQYQSINIYQKIDKTFIDSYTIQQSQNYLLIAFSDCLYILNEQIQVIFKSCQNQFLNIIKFVFINDSQIISISKNLISLSSIDFSIQQIAQSSNQITSFQNIGYIKYNSKYDIIYIFDQQQQQIAILDLSLNIIDQFTLQQVSYMIDVFNIVDDSFQNKYRYFVLFNCNIQTLPYKYCLYTMLSGQSSVFYLNNLILLLNIVDVVKYTNYLNQVVYKIYVALPLSYTSLILAVKWNLQTGYINQDSFTFYRIQNASFDYKEDSNKVIYQGHTSGNVALTKLVSNPGKMFYQTQQSSSQIQTIKQVYDLGNIYIVKKTLLVYDISQQLFVEEINIDDDYDNSLEYIQGFQYSKKLKLITCYKSQYFLILNYQQNIKTKYILKNFTYISNYYLQEESKFIYIYGSDIYKYNLQTGNLQIIFESQNYRISSCIFLDSYIVCQTGQDGTINKLDFDTKLSNGFVFDRSSQQQQAVFQILGNFVDSLYLEDYNHVLYYTDNTSQGQVFVFSITKLSQLTPLKAYFPLNQVRSLFYDKALSFLCLTDIYGFIQMYFYASQTNDNPVNVDEFYQNKKLSISNDFSTGNMIIYDEYKAYILNYNTMVRTFISAYYPQNQMYIANQNSLNNGFLIASLNNVLYNYKNQGYVYQTDFIDKVFGMYQSTINNNIIIIFQSYFLVYQNIETEQISSQNYTYKIDNLSLSQFIDDDIFITTSQLMIHFSFQQKKILFQIQFSQTEILKSYYLNSANQLVIFGFSSGKVSVYNKAYQLYSITNQQINQSVIDIFMNKDKIWIIYLYGKAYVFTIDQFIINNNQVQKPINNLDFVQLVNAQQNLEQSQLELRQVLIDDLNQEIFIHFEGFKQIYSIAIIDYSVNCDMLFPHNLYNYLQVSNSFILLQSSSQLNIHLRSTKKLVFYIRDNFRRQQLQKTFIFNESILILQFLQKISIYQINQYTPNGVANNDSYFTQIDTQTLSYPQIMQINLSNTSRILQIIGFSTSSIFHFQYDISKVINSLSNQCSSIINFKDPYKFYANMLLLQSSTTNLQTIYINVDDSFNFMNLVNQLQNNFILQSSINQEFRLNLQSLTYLQYKSSLKNFNFKFLEKGQYNFNKNIEEITIENSKISEQTIAGVQLNFQNQKTIIINRLILDNIFDLQSNQNSESTPQYDQFIYFFNCSEVYIYNLEIRTLSIQNLAAVLLFEEINQVQINNLIIENNIIQNSLIKFRAVQNLSISYIQIQNNLQSEFQGQQIFLLSGCLYTIITNANITKNINIQFFNAYNYYYYNNTVIYLKNDTINLKEIYLYQNQQNQTNKPTNPVQNFQDIPLIQIQSSFVNIQNMVSISNNMNILLNQSALINIENSLFQYNTALEGGAVSIQSVLGNIYFKNSTFSYNQAYANGGAILFDTIQNISFDQSTNIQSNKAIIGGGIRVRGIQEFNLIHKGQIINNSAEIYGENIATYPNQIQVQLFSQTNDQLKYENSSLTNKGQIFIKDFQSGGSLDIYIFLMDSYGKYLNFSINRFKQEQYPQVIQKEIQQWNAHLDFFNKSSIQIIGESSINYNQYNETTKSFSFQSIKINSIPFTTQQIVLEYSLVDYIQQNQILINIDFRKCQKGEIDSILNDQIRACVPCNIGQYSMYEYSQNDYVSNIECQKCPEESQICTKDSFVLKQGYWRKSNISDLILQCTKYQEACNEQEINNVFGCIQGYVGPLCEQCDYSGSVWQRRYSENSSKTGCSECSPISYQIILITITSLLILLYLLLQIIFIVWNLHTYQSCYYLRMMNLLPISVSQLKNVNTFYIKCLMSYLQLQTILVGEINKIPQFIALIPNTFAQPSSFTVVDTLCIISSETLDRNGPGKTKLIISQIYNLILGTITICLILIAEKFKFNQVNFKKYLRYNAFYFLYTFMQPDSLRMITKFLTCRTIGDKQYFTEDLQIECYQSDYQQFQQYIGIPLLVFWIIFPAIIFLQICKKSKNLDFSSTIFRYGYFFIEYKKSKYYWEFVRIYLKVLIVIFFTLNNGNQQLSYMIIVIFKVIYIAFLNNSDPFLNKKMIKVEQLSFFNLIALIILQIIQNIYDYPLVIRIIMILLHFAFIAHIIWIILYHKLLTKRNIFGKIFLFIISKILSKGMLDQLQKHVEVSMKTYQKWKKIRKSLKFLIDLKAINKMNQKISQQESQMCINLVSPKIKLESNFSCQTPILNQQELSKLDGIWNSPNTNILSPSSSQISPTKLFLNNNINSQNKKQSQFFQFVKQEDEQKNNNEIQSENQDDIISVFSENFSQNKDQALKFQDKFSIQTITSLNQGRPFKTQKQ